MKYLLSNNFEAILEVFRVFANLTRHRIVRNYLVDRKGNLKKFIWLKKNPLIFMKLKSI